MSITPVLVYPDVGQAVDWLVRVFGLVEHIRIGEHRAQLGFGDGALIVADASHDRRPPGAEGATHSVMVRVSDVDQHHDRAAAAGAEILRGPETQPFGERQYLAGDLAGHQWTFTQSVLDVSPEDWGGTTVTAW
jgi:uncharacterized glyoxalase superfamily protein PhnB